MLARDSQSLSTVSGFNRVATAAEQLRAAVHEVEEGLTAQKAAFQRLQASCKVRYHFIISDCLSCARNPECRSL